MPNKLIPSEVEQIAFAHISDGEAEAALEAIEDWLRCDLIAGIKAGVKAALEGDSNDAEHDALVDVAQSFGIDYEPPE